MEGDADRLAVESGRPHFSRELNGAVEKEI